MIHLRLYFLIYSFVLAPMLLAADEVYVGLVEPFRDVLLSPAVSGRIEKLPVKEGDRVKEGELLLSLVSRVEELEVERRRVIQEDKSEVESARERLALLKKELESARALAKRTGSVSQEELNRKQLETVLAGLEVSRLEQAHARERIELEMARERLALQKITAPFSGVVAQLPLDEGESVQANQQTIRLVEDTRAFLVVNLPADVARELKMGESVRLRFSLASPVEKPGEVAFLSPVVDPASGLRRVKLLFDNTNPRIEPGISGEWVSAP